MSWIMCLLRSRLEAAKYSRQDPAHGTVVLVRVLLLFESAMYSAIAPVLPHYAHALGASKPAVGVLAGAYPAGIIPGSLVGAWIATRAGVRRTTLVGLLLFAVSIAGFGFATSIVALDALRFVQGAGCGFIWGGGLTWVITVASRERRGEMLGSVIGAAIFGTLIGPVLGILAVSVGTGPVFAVVGAVACALAVWTQGHPEPVRQTLPAETSSPVRDLVASPLIRLGSWLILLEAATIGATSALLPLRLARFGAHSIVIGAVFLVSSLISVTISAPIGRLVDRRGAGVPLCVGAAGHGQRDRARRAAHGLHHPRTHHHHRHLRAARHPAGRGHHDAQPRLGLRRGHRRARRRQPLAGNERRRAASRPLGDYGAHPATRDQSPPHPRRARDR
jgi:hypothetical protein